ncbi:MAG TPA: beta-N-acetylglucosaminidase domain-containing protein [Candidatus Polarisedimenticolaceae bacterium]
MSRVRPALAPLVFALLLFAVSSAVHGGFERRWAKLGGAPGTPAVDAHVAFALNEGFNGFFVYSHQAGAWTARQAPDGPFLTPAFRAFAARCRERGIPLLVSINPVADDGGGFVFSETDGERRILRFVALLRAEGVREIVLSFDDQPTRLTELRDVLRYGFPAAPAHLDLTRRVARRLRRDTTLWLCASAYCDRHLGVGSTPYAKAFLSGLKRLPAGVGVVWTGPTVVSPTITREDLARTRERLGGRRLLLYDNYPVDDDPGDALAVPLGPIRGRGPDLHLEAAAYLHCPISRLGANRLAMLTVAAWLRDPARYVPEAAWKRARELLAGSDPAARTALETQSLEWGAWVDSRFWSVRERENPETAAAALGDPVALDRWTWVAARYPDRMAALGAIVDRPFRDDLLDVMSRRLAVARALPLAEEYRARRAAGRPDASALLDALDTERAALAADPGARAALERTLAHAAIPLRPLKGP